MRTPQHLLDTALHALLNTNPCNENTAKGLHTGFFSGGGGGGGGGKC